MNFLFKALLIRRSREQGFAIPIVTMLGLIMTFLALASIWKAGEQNVTATTQRETSKALAAAEAGVAYYMNFLSRNSTLATSDFDRNNPTNPANPWNNTTNLSCDSSPPLQTQTLASNDGAYQIIDYKYESYDATTNTFQSFNGNPPNNFTRGVLTVQGTRNNAQGNILATSRVRVEIPIRPETIGASFVTATNTPIDVTTSLNPAVWVDGTDTNNFGNTTVSYTTLPTGESLGGNIVVSRPPGTSNNLCDPSGTGVDSNLLQDSTQQSIIVDSRRMPNILDYTLPSIVNNKYSVVNFPDDIISKTSATTNLIRSIPRPVNLDPNTSTIDNARVIDTVPEPDAPPPNNQNNTMDNAMGENKDRKTYYYLVNGPLNLRERDSIRVNDGTKVVLMVRGDITIEQGASILSFNPAAGVDPNTAPGFPSSYLEIYGNCYVDAVGNCIANGNPGDPTKYGGAATTKITFATTATAATPPINIRAFIHAPSATVTEDLAGGTPTVNYTGSIWVNRWNTPQSTINITPDFVPSGLNENNDPNIYQSSMFYTSGLNDNPFKQVKPKVFPPTKWETVDSSQ
jgi:Tfp pilus assembly protein PilX